MTDERPPTPEEEAQAEALRRALERGTDEGLARTARLVASAGAPPLPAGAWARVRGAVAEEAARRRVRRRRWAVGAAALATAAGVATVLLVPVREPKLPATPYAKVFPRPFERGEGAHERLRKILAWRRGELDR